METVDKIVIKKGIQIKFNSKKENFEGKLNNIFFFFSLNKPTGFFFTGENMFSVSFLNSSTSPVHSSSSWPPAGHWISSKILTTSSMSGRFDGT